MSWFKRKDGKIAQITAPEEGMVNTEGIFKKCENEDE